ENNNPQALFLFVSFGWLAKPSASRHHCGLMLRYAKILEDEFKLQMFNKLYASILLILIVLLCVIAAAALWSYQTPSQTGVAGVTAGDVFTYSIKGYATKFEVNATIPENFLQVNMTEWYRVTITQVNDSEVSFSATW